MDLTPRDVHDKQFHDAWRGYNQEEVDDFLDKIAEALDRLTRENSALQTRLRELDQAVSTSRDTEEMLKKTLVTAQKAAEEAISSAKGKAEQLISEAENRAKAANAQVQERLAHVDEEMRRKNLEAEREHAQKRRELEHKIESLAGFESDLKQKLRTFLEQQLGSLDGLIEKPKPSRGANAPAQKAQPQRTQPQKTQPAAPSPAGSPMTRTTPAPTRQNPAPPSARPADRFDAPGGAPPASVTLDEQVTAPAGVEEPEPARRGLRGLIWGEDKS
jgi:cell division initiation protein